jgi:hypothetical protein
MPSFCPTKVNIVDVHRETFTEQLGKHWHIEQYHRAIKQVCNIERFPSRYAARPPSRTTCLRRFAVMFNSIN